MTTASDDPVGTNPNVHVDAHPINIEQFEFQAHIINSENYDNGNGNSKLFINVYTNPGEGTGNWYGHRFSLMTSETRVASNGVTTFVVNPEVDAIFADSSNTTLADWRSSQTGILGIFLSTDSQASSLQINVQNFCVKFYSG